MDAARALACGIPEEPYRTVDSVEPSDGSNGFPRDGAVRIQLKPWPQHTQNGMLSVQVSRVGDAEAVAGKLEQWLPDQYTWAPDEPFAANTQYRVEVTTTTEPFADVDAPTMSSTTFTTSDERVPDLRLATELHVSVHRGTAPKLDYSGVSDCAEPAPVIGERPALIAEVELPRVSGGFDAYGYKAWLALNNDAATTFRGPGADGRMAPGAGMVVLGRSVDPKVDRVVSFEVPLEDVSYAACFAFNAWDAAGHWGADSFCVPADELDPEFAWLRAANEDAGGTAARSSDASVPGDDHDAAVVDDASVARGDGERDAQDDAGTASVRRHAAGPHSTESSSCAVTSGVGAGHVTAWAWLAPGLAALIRRRRR
jgi:MYXO-CTERM domain-containing protein